MQDDLLYESLTVYETLYYAAMLRLPQHMDHDAKTGRVDTVITALGLSSCKDTIIGQTHLDSGNTVVICLHQLHCTVWSPNAIPSKARFAQMIGEASANRLIGMLYMVLL